MGLLLILISFIIYFLIKVQGIYVRIDTRLFILQIYIPGSVQESDSLSYLKLIKRIDIIIGFILFLNLSSIIGFNEATLDLHLLTVSIVLYSPLRV